MQANDEMALLPLGTRGCCQHGDPRTLAPQHQQLSGRQRDVQAGLQGDGGLAGCSAELRSGSPFAGQGSNLVWERGWRCGDGLAASLLEIQALGEALQSLPGW